MRSNLHTHSNFCDGKNSCEEIVLSAIEKDFSSIGFSGHGYTDFDLRYCITDVDGYIDEVNRLREKYKNQIQVYLGVEEDVYCMAKRERYDYIIGSCHYYFTNGKHYPIDSSPAHFKKCLEAYGYNVKRMTEDYYSSFCSYIKSRKPDIIGHFDLITKFDEMGESLFLGNGEYIKISEKYTNSVADLGCLFEVNTGAISRGYRHAPYPAENLLHIIKKRGGGVILSSDSHSIETLDFGFDDALTMLKEIGFTHVYNLLDGKFVKEEI